MLAAEWSTTPCSGSSAQLFAGVFDFRALAVPLDLNIPATLNLATFQNVLMIQNVSPMVDHRG